jgi:hypothetical protein
MEFLFDQQPLNEPLKNIAMTNTIDQLYAAIRLFQEQDIAIPQEMIDQIEQREKSVLDNEILPDLQVTLEKTLGRLTKPLLLLVDYVPGDGLVVKIATRRKFTEARESTICSDGEDVKRKNFKMFTPQTKSRWTGLLVTFSDGKQISNRFACDTLADCIQKIGVSKVLALDLKYSNVALVSDKKDRFYQQTQLSSGHYIFTHGATELKKKILTTISDKLNLGLKVEILD